MFHPQKTLRGVMLAATAIAVGLVSVESTLAGGAERTGTMAVATGLIDDDIEGLYTLDFVTGELQCFVINPRTGKLGGVFRVSVLHALPAAPAAKPDYLLVAGFAEFPRGAGAMRPGRSIVYVTDANTGKFAAYCVPWNSATAKANKVQMGQLTLLDGASARPVPGN